MRHATRPAAATKLAAGTKVAAVIALLALPLAAHAHTFAPALLTARELSPGRIELRFTPPADRPDAAAPAPPAGCTPSGPTAPDGDAGRDGDRNRDGDRGRASTLVCPTGLLGLTFPAPPDDAPEVLLRLAFADGTTLTSVLAPGSAPFTVPRPEQRSRVPARYLGLGVAHILGGLDHLLFVLGLTLLTGRRRALVSVLTAFTLGHSLTLALATLGLLALPAPPTEALIALSLVLLAVELARPRDSLLRRRPHLGALAFGLLHGLGFAGALAQVGLPKDALPLALAAFNAGVELGQLAFVAALLAAWMLATRVLASPRLRSATSPRASAASLRALPAYALGTLGVCLLLDRVSAFWELAR